MTQVPHQIRLGDSGWRVWDLSGLRAAGFPARQVLALRDPVVAAAADRANSPANTTTEEEYARGYVEAWLQQSRTLAKTAADPAFREAVTWQAPHLVPLCLDKVVHHTETGMPTSRQRDRLLKVASYLQRFAAKCDTVGFFGPIGWSRWGTKTRVVPGSALIARRITCLETWAVDALVDCMAEDPDLVGSFRPRPAPQNLITNGQVVDPLGKNIALHLEHLELLRLVDGDRSVAELASACGEPVAKTVARLRRLADQGVVRIAPDVPVSAYPDRALRKVLTDIGSSAAAHWLRQLDDLEAARNRVAAAAGEAVAVQSATTDLHTTFHRVTGLAPERHAGQMYAGRTVVYQDAVRDVTVELGNELLETLARPLELLLTSARWLVAELGERYRVRFRELFDKLTAAPRPGGAGQQPAARTLPLGRLYSAAVPDLMFSFGDPPDLVADVTAEFQRRWARILALPPGRSHHIGSAAIRQQVLQAFPSRRPYWSGALRHSPDIMLAAESAEALTAGKVLVVLGELHVATNSLQARCLAEQAPEPEGLRIAEAQLHAGRRVVLLPSKSSPGVNSRTHPSALYGHDETYCTMFPDPTYHPERLLPAAGLHVVAQGDDLVVRSSSGEEFALLEVFGELLSTAVMNSFRLLPSAPHRPRVTVDQLVVSRESWSCEDADLDWCRSKGAERRFREARRWQSLHGLPDRCFYRVAGELKPLLVDFTSVALVEVLARAVRLMPHPSAVTFTEMLPDINDLWLSDMDDNRYVAELRIIAVDGEHASPT